MTYNSSVELDLYRQIYLKCNIRVQSITSVWKHSLDVSLQPLFSMLCQFQRVVHMHSPTFYMHLFIRIDLRSSWKFTWNKSSPHIKSSSGIVFFLCPLISEYLRNFVIHLNHKAKKRWPLREQRHAPMSCLSHGSKGVAPGGTWNSPSKAAHNCFKHSWIQVIWNTPQFRHLLLV